MNNPYESPQDTTKVPVAECNHISMCRSCKIDLVITFITVIILIAILWYQAIIIERVNEYENTLHVKVYERPDLFKWIKTWKK